MIGFAATMILQLARIVLDIRTQYWKSIQNFPDGNIRGICAVQNLPHDIEDVRDTGSRNQTIQFLSPKNWQKYCYSKKPWNPGIFLNLIHKFPENERDVFLVNNSQKFNPPFWMPVEAPRKPPDGFSTLSGIIYYPPKRKTLRAHVKGTIGYCRNCTLLVQGVTLLLPIKSDVFW